MEKLKKTNKNAICSLVFAIISYFVFWWLAIGSIVLGIKALNEIKVQDEKGKPLAIMGIILGIIAIILYFVFV